MKSNNIHDFYEEVTYLKFEVFLDKKAANVILIIDEKEYMLQTDDDKYYSRIFDKVDLRNFSKLQIKISLESYLKYLKFVLKVSDHNSAILSLYDKRFCVGKEIKFDLADLEQLNSNKIPSELTDVSEIIKYAFSVEKGITKMTPGRKSINRNNYLQIRESVNQSKANVIDNLKDSVGKKLSNNVGESTNSKGSIDVFFGTNRNRTGEKDVSKYFGSDFGGITVGKCRINIPNNHLVGNIERPRKIFWWRGQESKEKHVILEDILEIPNSVFYKMLKSNLADSNEKSFLLFIHGFNTTFVEAAWRTGQIAYDIPFNGLTGFFSWPSKGESLAYIKDIDQAESSWKDFSEFVENLVLKTDVEKLHIIAHSMGSRILTKSLDYLSKSETFKDKINSIHEIVFAAPDLDQYEFKKNWLPALSNIGSSRTLYASNKDRALFLSNYLRKTPRLGQSGKSIFIEKMIDTIDASNVNSIGIHHNYVFENDEVLSDLHLLLNGKIKPQERRLKVQYNDENKEFWMFPKNRK